MADYSLIDTPNGPRPEWWPEVKEVDRDEAEVLWKLGVPVYHEFWGDLRVWGDSRVCSPYCCLIEAEDELTVEWYENEQHYFFYVKP